MKKIALILSMVLAMPLFTSCGSKGGETLPNITGKAGEIIVVINKAQWESDLGGAIREVLSAEYEYLPQKEPVFNIANVPEASVNKLIKVHRNMMYVKVAPGAKTAVEVRNNVWAQPQTMVIISAPDDESAAACIRENGGKIVEAFEKAERDRSIANAKLYEEKALRDLVENKYGGSPYFPNGYSLKKQTPDFLWISYETSYTIQGIFIYSYPYEGPEQLTSKALIAKRNEVTKENVPATMDGSYMITNPSITPGYRKVNYNGIERIEIRSLWDTHNDFMGGPFVSHTFLSPDGDKIITIEGFIYAPKYNKRNYLRQIESIICSFQWK